ncbi:MAG: signal peptidase I [Patescibacteria group bacterium]
MKFFRLPSWLQFIWDLVKLVIIAFIIVWPIHRFVFQPFLVQGPSMEPNFYDKEYLIIEEVSYRFTQPRRGEIIVFRPSSNPNNYLIKRIIALPNERIVIKNGNIYIYNDEYPQGIKLQENYLSPGVSTSGEIDQKLGPDEYFVLGDNRQLSLDSRSFGPIKRKEIIGRTWLRGWPLNRVAKFQVPVYTY